MGTSTQLWGENPKGRWTVSIKLDSASQVEHIGMLINLKLVLYGTQDPPYVKEVLPANVSDELAIVRRNEDSVNDIINANDPTKNSFGNSMAKRSLEAFKSLGSKVKNFFSKRSPKGLEDSEKAVNMENLETSEEDEKEKKEMDEEMADEA